MERNGSFQALRSATNRRNSSTTNTPTNLRRNRRRATSQTRRVLHARIHATHILAEFAAHHPVSCAIIGHRPGNSSTTERESERLVAPLEMRSASKMSTVERQVTVEEERREGDIGMRVTEKEKGTQSWGWTRHACFYWHCNADEIATSI
ncbi:hypothetical protein BD410DRAFT_796969 [Rickenella mellea]|uniref:Uncharacterized protein n=1 Tax=Rickenella mellea TaxID=50990 RepID=A0A4Y7PHB2_9AGAM|nr:hypothetical protein BD410DRAFT_796969 [Rickenella mellea]